MNTPTLRTVLENIKSDKATLRQQGLISLRETFSRDSAVDNFDSKGKGKGNEWLVVFQALFTNVVTELRATLKKGTGSTAAAERRLKDAAAIVRWLTERSVTKWPSKVARPLVKHLLQAMRNGGHLVAPVALDYVKALRVVFSHPSHRDNLMTDFKKWLPVLSFAFAVVLEEDLDTTMEDEPEITSEAEVSLALSEDDGTPARKRRKIASQAAGRSSRPSAPRTASPEQIEFVALIATLLRSPRCRLLAPDRKYLVSAVLNRLARFFTFYPVETSAHLDAISAVQATLDAVALNARDEVIKFGTAMWDNLLQLWSSKSRPMKEAVLMVLKTLFPYVAHADHHRFDRAEGFSRLLKHLQADHASRWGFDELDLDSLRMEITHGIHEPFVAHTFRHGFNFSAGQAASWVILELTVDVIKELYMLTESAHSATENNRTRLENPIKLLLQAIQKPKSVRGQVYALQSLAFVAERHWPVLYPEIRLEIIDCLLHMITSDEPSVQSWTFCCLAAIAYADTSSRCLPEDSIASRWDAVWSHSMRRTSAPIICRLACHTAHVLLACAKLPMTRVLAEIETMAQDINVQGPAAPHDSVCAFLGRCIRIASQDTRLHRMHLDDKVLSWLIENWNVSSGISRSASGVNNLRLEQHTVQDTLNLLESACGISRASQLFCPIPLPQHAIVDMMQSQMDTAVIQEFLLNARFPDDRTTSRLLPSQSSKIGSTENKGDLSQPDARIRKASAFFLKMLESIIPVLEESSDATLRPPAENVRRTLDFAVLAVCFESSLVLNGIANNRRSLLAACKLIGLLAPHLVDLGWSLEELFTLLSSFSPLSQEYLAVSSSSAWEAFISPGRYTGVRRTVTNSGDRSWCPAKPPPVRHLQSVIWRSSDVQDALSSVLRSMRQILRTFVSEESRASDRHLTPVVDDDRDGFGPIRTANTPLVDGGRNKDDFNGMKRIVEICIDSLALAPVLRSDGQVVKDRSLVELICSCMDVEKFGIILEPFLLHVRNGNIRLSPSNVDALLTYIEEPLQSYNYKCSDSFHIVVIRLLDATASSWLQSSFPEEISTKVQAVISWLAESLREDSLCSWQTRDMLARFWNHYLELDHLQNFVSHLSDPEVALNDQLLPDKLLPSMTRDEDIRVRFTVALSCARLFSTAYIRSKDPMEVYTTIREQLCIKLDNYEHLLTRFVCLGNILIASSAVRRGAYWHLLETCLHTSLYIKHIESVLRAAANKMGLVQFSDLFESYASQIAYSIRMSDKDFFILPPHLLGYRDRKERAEATFAAFSPTNLLASPQDEDDVVHGHGPFARHCLLINRAPIDGLLRCFADIVGYQIVFWIDDNQNPSIDRPDAGISSVNIDVSGLFDRLEAKFASLGSAAYLRQQIAQNVDGIVCSILRTNGDLDCHREGSIVKTFENFRKPERCVRAFRALMQFRGHGEFEMHVPNVPSLSASVVLAGLNWLCDQVETANSAASTYHVMQYFFATIAECPLINEQLRLLISLCMWISLAHSHFKNATLLRVLMNGSIMLLAQPDLATIAQGMLDWAFIHLRETQRDTPHVVEILIRICSIAREFSLSEDDAVRKLGSRLQTWIENQIISLAEIEILRKRIAVALAAWPGVLNDRLLSIRGSLSFEELSTILDDPYLSYHKFKIVRRLSELSSSASYDKDQFARQVFWRLKDSIPTADLVPEEVDAFTSLLVANSGHIRNQAVDQTYGRSIATRQLKLGTQKNAVSVKRPIVQALLDLLTDHSAQAVQVAYRTLRLLAGNESLDAMEYGTWPAEYRGDISYLDFCPVKENNNVSRDLSEINQPRFHESASNFSLWISIITTFLAEVLSRGDRFYAHLSDILSGNTDFAAQMFPVLVHTLLLSDQGENAHVVLSGYLTRLLAQSDITDRCHRSVINLILHLRHFDPGVTDDDLAYNRWLDVDFMLLSRSAIKCGAYTTALLFLELAAEYRQASEADDKLSEQILFDIYSHIDEPDGFYGIKTLDLQDFLIRRFHHEKQWDKAFQFHGAGFEAGGGGPRSHNGIVESLHSFGFNKLAMSVMQSMQSSSRSGDIEYQLGWRTETWDLPDPVLKEVPGATLYVALRAIHRERDTNVIDDIVLKSLSDELRRLRGLGIENLAEIRQVTQNLMCLAQIRRWRDSAFQNNLFSSTVTVDDIVSSDFCSLWQNFDFSDLESIVATRISLLHSARQKEQKEQIGDLQSDLTRALFQAERHCLLQLSEAARYANQTQVALNSIMNALHLDEAPGFEVQQEFANVLWLQHERKYAVDCLKSEVQHRRQDLSQGDDTRKVQDALTLAKLGEWTTEACLEKPAFIHSQYFLPAIDLLVGGKRENLSLGDVRADVFYKCALFAEQQYQALISSEEIKRLQVYRERKTQEIAERKQEIQRAQTKKQAQELTGHQRKAEALFAQDSAQLKEFIGARDNYLRQAVEMLALCLQASDSFDIDAVIRLCSLWFANFKDDVAIVQGTINRIPSRKFVFLAHQLSARLSVVDTSNANQNVLQSLLLRMCSEHPFHSLYQVYSLQSSHDEAMSSRRRSSGVVLDGSQADRAEAAFGIFERLLEAPDSSSRARLVKHLCNAYLEWAKYPIKNDPVITDRKSRKSDKLMIPRNLSILCIKDLRVPVTTANTPLDPTMRYDNCVWIHGYQDSFDVAGGINLPKICYCIGSDGIKYKQLFKGEGNDDLRQDAVMEQVFELCNQVLNRDQQTRKRELSIRSYKVIPLASQAGLLEFVGNTRPLQFLVAAHERYNRTDLTSKECHRRLAQRRIEAQRTLDGAAFKQALVDEFTQIRQRFRPVMRHFFSEQRKEPQAWFEMRLKYSRSVAVNSIVGHILGLGDRHLSNILIDTVTGEVVHIDLGIAFEQGKLLPIPERVPFRLTADIVDGFGMSGADGVFRRCAEETLRVLRDGSGVIKTVLEVFKYDPLHSWTMSAMKIRKAQAGTNASNNNHNDTDKFGLGTGLGIDLNSGVEDESADRALSSVAKKLDKSLSVEYTVNELIAEATDVANLALMFAGWSPHC
ncbi:TEL1 [Sanghuangporus weigelae]